MVKIQKILRGATINFIQFKISSYIFIIIGIFLLIDFIGYKIIHNAVTSSHEKDATILFYNIQTPTSELLSKLMYQYSTQKEILIEKHRDVAAYLNDKPYDVNLDEINKKINQGSENSPYNIYITDEALVIRNSTFKADIGFDLSFAKETFDQHHSQSVVGCCSPLFEKSSKDFLSYTDSYIANYDDKNRDRVLQISFTYFDAKQQLLKIQDLIKNYPTIKDAQAYIIVNSGFVNDITLKDYPAYKPDLKEIQARIKDGEKIKNRLGNETLDIRTFIKDGTPYKEICLSSANAIFDDTKIVYSILFDETDHFNKLKTLNILMVAITFLGLVTIFIITKIRAKETRLSDQDKFVQSSMHEIKTPLSVITLNNELRQLELGEDEYSSEIDSALKTLQNSYDDMSFIVTKDKLDYPLEILDLSEQLIQRVAYFKSIASAHEKSINLICKSNCKVEISFIELTRVIDNNLSNAIKYSEPNSTISVVLNDNVLTFANKGNPVQNTKKVFTKYFRENSVVGGFGLGLSIVNDIAKKYSIAVSLSSDQELGTIFSYTFKCHTTDKI